MYSLKLVELWWRIDMRKSFIVEVYVHVEIEDSKLEQALKDYRECIKATATIDDVFAQVAYNEANGGGFCEGVGENGKEFKAEITGIECEANWVEEGGR